MRPYATVQNEEFKYMFQTLEPKYKVPSRTHFTEAVMPQLLSTVASRVKAKIDAAKYVAVATDAWTSRTTENFVAVTAHFIND